MENITNIYDERMPRIQTTPRYSAYVKIAEGCNNGCTFCIIPSMRGDLVSRPVGSVLEEAAALKRAGIKDIVMCEENRKNIEEIPEMYLKGLSFHYVNDVSEVLNFALLDEKVKNAIEFTFDEPKNETK